jgi:hypothetical protein
MPVLALGRSKVAFGSPLRGRPVGLADGCVLCGGALVLVTGELVLPAVAIRSGPEHGAIADGAFQWRSPDGALKAVNVGAATGGALADASGYGTYMGYVANACPIVSVGLQMPVA